MCVVWLLAKLADLINFAHFIFSAFTNFNFPSHKGRAENVSAESKLGSDYVITESLKRATKR